MKPVNAAITANTNIDKGIFTPSKKGNRGQRQKLTIKPLAKR